MMNCRSCGKEIAEGIVFCPHCGASVSGSGGSTRSALKFEGGALALTGWSLLNVIGFALVIPAPFVLPAYLRWFAEKTKTADGAAFGFVGTAGSVWVLTTLLMTVQYANNYVSAQADKPDPGLIGLWALPLGIASLALNFYLVRWAAGHAEIYGQRLEFTGGLLPFLGWTLLTIVSFITIIGWAWVYKYFIQWYAEKTVGSTVRFTFLGSGLEILWRTLATVVLVLPIVTIPWVLRWYTAWIVSRFEVSKGAAMDPAVS